MSKLTLTMTGVYVIFWFYHQVATTLTSNFTYCGRDNWDNAKYCSPGYHCCSTMRNTCCPYEKVCLGETGCITCGGIVGIVFGSLFGLTILVSLVKCCCKACDPERSPSVNPN